MFHYVLTKALYGVTLKCLLWWSQSDIVYSRIGELRTMVTDIFKFFSIRLRYVLCLQLIIVSLNCFSFV